jgi:hypothetical protein
MKKVTFILILLFLLSYNLVYSQNQNIFGIGGGISKVTSSGFYNWNPFFNSSSTSKNWNMGFHIDGEWLQKVSKNFLIGWRVGYNRWSPNKDEVENEPDFLTDVSGSASMIELIPSIRFLLPQSQKKQTQFFGQVGAGYYLYNMKVESSTTFVGVPSFFNPGGGSSVFSTEERDYKFGINFAAGTIIGSSGQIKFSVCPMYNIIFTEEPLTNYFTVILGIVFGKE